MPAKSEDGRNPPENPSIVCIEPHSVDVRPDYGVGGVQIEVVDRTGRGFRTIFDPDAAVDLCLRAIAAVARLRGYTP